MDNNVKELKELLDFGFAVQDALVKSLEDGKVTTTDAINFFPVISSAGAAFNNLGNPLIRFKQLDQNQRRELGLYAAKRFDIPHEVLENLIERTLVWAYGTLTLGLEWAVFAKDVTEEEEEA
jgi:hypothetical protein